MSGAFKRATKAQARARIALCGPAGSGKTFSALALACSLGQRVAVIDTERGSASKYAGRFAFDVLELQSFETHRYVEAIADAEREGYDVIVVDSLSHAWSGKGGALEQVDRKRGGAGSSFDAWRTVTPQHNALVDAMLRSRAHVVATMRTKTEYVVEQVNGRAVPRKIGLAPVQRDGVEYEFDVVGDLDVDHRLTITKSRCEALADQVIDRPGRQLATVLREWLDDGVAPQHARVQQQPEAPHEPPPREPDPEPQAAVPALELTGELSFAEVLATADVGLAGKLAAEAAARGDTEQLTSAYVRALSIASSREELRAIASSCKAEPLFAGLQNNRPRVCADAYAHREAELRAGKAA